MKTVVIACASCLLLAGGTILLKQKDVFAFMKLESFQLNRLSAGQHTNTHRKSLDAETSLAPVETLPVELTIRADQALAMAAPVLNKDEASSRTLIDNHWNGHLSVPAESKAIVDRFSDEVQPMDPPALMAEHVPFVAEDLEEREFMLETRRLMDNLNPEKSDSERTAASARVAPKKADRRSNASAAAMIATVVN